MKRIALYACAIIGITAVLMFTFYGPYANGVSEQLYYNHRQYKGHITIIEQDTKSFFWNKFESGCAESLNENDFVVQYIGSTDITVNAELNLLHKAISSKIQGIIVQGYQTDSFVEEIDRAVAKGIPVMTVNSDVYGSSRTAYVGPDNYKIGAVCFDTLSGSESGNSPMACIAIIADNYLLPEDNLLIKGFTDRIPEESPYTVSVVVQPMLSVLDVIEKTEKLLLNNPEIDVYYCTNPVATLGVVRAVINLNKVDTVKIIGVGCTPELCSYVHKGVVDFVVDQNSEKIGQIAMRNLCLYNEGKAIDDTIYTEYDIIDHANAENWLAG